LEARVIVLADGSVGGARLVESSHDDFTAAVREALRETRFHPALRRGKPVSAWVMVRLRFRIEE
jgi:TonB family protein